MVEYLDKYQSFIKIKGVGSNDIVSYSVESYVSYMNSVSTHLDISVGPKNLSTEHDITSLSGCLSKSGKVSEKTIKNYRSAMRQYVRMVNEFGLAAS